MDEDDRGLRHAVSPVRFVELGLLASAYSLAAVRASDVRQTYGLLSRESGRHLALRSGWKTVGVVTVAVIPERRMCTGLVSVRTPVTV
jgi:hypothetical protein